MFTVQHCTELPSYHNYLWPLLPVEHRPSTTPPPPPTTSLPAITLCSGLLWPFQTSWSLAVSALLRCLASLSLPLRVPGQGLACGAGCWLPEGVSDLAPLPPQYLLGNWFLSHLLPQIFILGLLLPLDFVDVPQTGVECLDLLLHHLCCPPYLTSVEQDWLHIGVEDAEFGSHASYYNNNNNNNERISRALFHAKQAQLRWTGANTKIQNTCIQDSKITPTIQTNDDR